MGVLLAEENSATADARRTVFFLSPAALIIFMSIWINYFNNTEKVCWCTLIPIFHIKKY
jgi:hypothetical protein